MSFFEILWYVFILIIALCILFGFICLPYGIFVMLREAKAARRDKMKDTDDLNK